MDRMVHELRATLQNKLPFNGQAKSFHSSVMPEGIVVAEPITEKEVRGLFNLWNDALATKDPKKVANRYSKASVLLPTVSDVPRTDYPGIVDYFTKFLKLEPQGVVSVLLYE